MNTDQPTLAVQAHEWRKREVQAIGAAISTRSWHAVEQAYNSLRDKMDRAGCWHAPTRITHEPRPAGDLREAEQWLRAISDWLLTHDHDMLLPSGILDTDPLDIADRLATHSPAPMAVSLEDGEWFYPEGDHSSDECRFSVDEVIDDALNGLDSDRVVCIERAVSLPAIYAAVRVWTDAEKDARESDDDYDYTLFATADEARAALAAHPSTQEGGDRG